MKMATELHGWRRNILQQLDNRQSSEVLPYQELIASHNRLLNAGSAIKLRNSELEHLTYQLKQEIHELQGKVAIGNNGTTLSGNEKHLEQKIYKLQEEVTELHRNKGENAQTIIQLTNQLKEKDEQLNQKEAQILDSQNNVEALSVESRRLQLTVSELESTNQMLKDEYQALQMLHSSLETKMNRLQEDNMQLVDRWMQEKAKVADQINFENEMIASLRQKKLQQQLQDAANEPIQVKNISYTTSPGRTGSFTVPATGDVCITSIPDRARYIMDAAHDGEVTALRFSPSGKYFVSGGSDRKVKVWEVGHGTCDLKGTLTGCNQSVMCAGFDSSEKMILGTSNDNACRIWGLHDQRLKHTLTGHTGKVLSAKFFGQDSSKVVSGSHDRTLKIWDLRSKACTKTIFAGSSCNDVITADVAGSSGHSSLLRTTIISGHFDKKLRYWDVRSDQNFNEIQLQGKISSLDLSRDMHYLLAATRDDALKMIDMRNNRIVSTFRTDGFKVACDYTRACFSPDGQFVMCGSSDGGVYIWNAKTNQLEKVLRTHKNPVVAAAWHPNGSCLISCDKNKHIILWTDI